MSRPAVCGGGAAGHPNYKIYNFYKKGPGLKFAIACIFRGYALLFWEIAERVSPEDDYLDLPDEIPMQRGNVLHWRHVDA